MEQKALWSSDGQRGDISSEPHLDGREHETISLWLNPQETHDLLKNAPPAYRTQVEDVLLAALVSCYSKSGCTGSLAIDFERDGRDMTAPECDLSRVVGCFAARFPVLLPVVAEEDWDPGKMLVATKERLRESLEHGIRLDEEMEQVRCSGNSNGIPVTKIRFCHLGDFDSILVESLIFRAEWHDMGPWINTGCHALGITTVLCHGRLNIAWSYDPALFSRETVEDLSESYVENLRLIVTHCCAQYQGGYTASDFPLIKRGAEELKHIATALARQRK